MAKSERFVQPAPKEQSVIFSDTSSMKAYDQKRKYQVVLPEEVHMKNLEKIINREFFPLLHRKTQLEEAKKLQEKSEIGLDDLDNDEDEEYNDVSDLTLSEYFARYTSEDNRAFDDLMEEDKKRWRKKFWWIFKSEKDQREKQLALQDSSNQKLNNMIEGNKETNLMITNYDSRNNFMFAPKSKKKFSDIDKDKSNQPMSISENTRLLQEQYQQIEGEKSTSSKFDNKQYQEQLLSTPNLNGIGSMPGMDKNGKVQGYSVLKMTSPSPSDGTPMMTWGEVDDAELLPGQKGGYKMPDLTKREVLRNSMPLQAKKEKLNQQLKQQKQKEKLLRSLTPKSTFNKLSSNLSTPFSTISSSKPIRKDLIVSKSHHRNTAATPKDKTSSQDKTKKPRANLPKDLLKD